MQRTADFGIIPQSRVGDRRVTLFAASLVFCVSASALMASWVPLQLSIVSVFLFAGPHNWFEFRYFLTRMPVRFGRSRDFFVVALFGIGALTLTYVSLPVLYSLGLWQGSNWPVVLAIWNTAFLVWLGLLIWQRGKQKRVTNWSSGFAVAFCLCSINWMAPELFSLAIVYAHPLVALWFLDRHLKRNRPEWLSTYRRGVAILPLVIGGMIWQLSRTGALPDDNGLFWRITQHAGAELLPGVSSRVLVSVHVFLEMLHYAVWIVALPLIARVQRGTNLEVSWSARDARDCSVTSKVLFGKRAWIKLVRSIPVARHPRGFPRLVATAVVIAFVAVVVLWLGFSMDYSSTRDIYFTVAIAHVLAEAPFLLKML